MGVDLNSADDPSIVPVANDRSHVKLMKEPTSKIKSTNWMTSYQLCP